MSRETAEFAEVWGTPYVFVDVPAERFSEFAGSVPDLLIDFWREFGYSGFHNGLLWICDPVEWQPAVDAWTAGVELATGPDQWIAVTRTAFGAMQLWGRRTGMSLEVVPHHGLIVSSDKSSRMTTADDRNDQIYGHFLSLESETLDIPDEDEQDVFDRVVELNAPVGPDTMYGLVPALALGGSIRAENFETVDARVHMRLLSEMTPRQIMTLPQVLFEE